MFVLTAETIHLWRLELDAQHAECDVKLLDAAERQRAGRFRFDHHRRRFITHRAWLRRVLALYLDCRPATLAFGLVANDKPVLAQGHGLSDLQFNLSHSDKHALCAVARGAALGVDIEQRRDIKDALAIGARHFGARELAWLTAAGNDDERMTRFFTVWTRKEAFIKATGEGLSRALSSFDVVPEQAGPVAVREIEPGAHAWYGQSLSLDGDVAAALCSRWPQPQLRWPALPPGHDAALRPATR